MKILFDHALPFALAHGGFQIQIEQSKAALERRGLEVEYVRWWDEEQRGDIIHHFGVPSPGYQRTAQAQKIPFVITHLFSAACNRSSLQSLLRGACIRGILRIRGIKNQLNAQRYHDADKMVVGLDAEKRVLQTVFGVSPRTIVQVPLGLHDDFLRTTPAPRTQPCLVTTGTINEVKRSVELARMAHEAQVPILFVGKPYNPAAPYWKEFAQLIDQRFVFHHEHVNDRAQLIELLQSSRGFVIYSRYENWCLSAHEAAACGLPLLVPDLPWSRERFGPQASYLHPRSDRDNIARLRAFYEACPSLPAPAIKLYSWDDVAEKLEACYRSLI
jgi:glycosyltransferase involved in cell wall biosynthesis